MIQARSAWRQGRLGLALLIILCWVAACTQAHGQADKTVPPFTGPASSAESGEQTAVLAGGCFWGVDAVFKHVRGVSQVVSGYAGGTAETATYDLVSTGGTGHAESVQITFDPSRVSYAQLLRIFFAVAHDPTQVGGQGPDMGPQYRSAIFFTTADQQAAAQAYVDQLNRAKVFPKRIATEVVPLKKFYPAEAYHQNYLARHPENPYIVFNDLPKLAELQQKFPTMYHQ